MEEKLIIILDPDEAMRVNLSLFSVVSSEDLARPPLVLPLDTRSPVVLHPGEVVLINTKKFRPVESTEAV